MNTPVSSEWRIIWFGHRIIDSVKYRIRIHFLDSWFDIYKIVDSDSDSRFGLLAFYDSIRIRDSVRYEILIRIRIRDSVWGKMKIRIRIRIRSDEKLRFGFGFVIRWEEKLRFGFGFVIRSNDKLRFGFGFVIRFYTLLQYDLDSDVISKV